MSNKQNTPKLPFSHKFMKFMWRMVYVNFCGSLFMFAHSALTQDLVAVIISFVLIICYAFLSRQADEELAELAEIEEEFKVSGKFDL